MTTEAVLLKEALVRFGIKVELEHFDGYKHVDLFLPDANVNIEVDGLQHLTSPKQIVSDLNREYYDNKKGFDTIHIQNIDIDYYLGDIAKGIAEMVISRKLEFLSKKHFKI